MDVLTDALKRGANTIDATSLGPRESEMDAARQRLAASATRIALDKARAVADAAGRRVGAIRSIVLDAPPPSPGPRPMMARVAAAPASFATDAGDSEVTATVTLTQALIEP